MPFEPLIQAVVERRAPLPDASNRAILIAPSIQAVVERQTRRTDAFR
jgi:hypothetical protein